MNCSIVAASDVAHQGLVLQGGTLNDEPLQLLERLSDSHQSLRYSLATKDIRVSGDGRGGGSGSSMRSDSGGSPALG